MESKVLKPICEIALEIKDGDWIESKDQSTSGIRLIQTGNIGNGEYLDKESRAKYISEDTFEELKCSEVFPGDILISRLPDPVGRSCVIPKGLGKMVTAVDCSIVRLDSKLIDPEYFIQFTNSNNYQKQISQFLTGTTRKRISRKNLEQIKVPTPTLEIQIIQSKILGTIDTLIKKLAKLNTLFDRLVRSRFIEMFGDPRQNNYGWPVKRIIDFSSCIAGGTPSTTKPEYWDNGTIPWMSSGEINKFRIKDTEKKITQKGFESSSTKWIPENTVVVALAGQGSTRGKAAITEIPLCANQSIIAINTNGEVDPEFLLQYLTIEYNELRKASNGDGGRGGLNKRILENYLLMIPPLNLQKEYADFCRLSDKSKFLQN